MIMRQSTIDFLKANFGEQLPIRQRYFNIVCIGATIFSLLATIVNFITGTGPVGLLVCALCTLTAMVSFPITKKFKNLDLWIYLILGAINFIIMPMLYFTIGGINSGMPLFFVIGIVFTIILVEKLIPNCIMVACEFAWYIAVIFVDKATKLSERFYVMGDNIYLDTALDFVVVTLCIGILVKILATNFERQQAKTDKLLAQMEELAVKDPLTGAYNRRFLIRYLETGIQNMRETNKHMAIVMFDIDKFKRINDDYGHLAGDEVIKALSSTLIKSCRDYDIVSRYGGEEFVLVMPGASEETAIARAESIRKAFSELKACEEIDRPITVSGGVAEIKPGIKTPEDFISAADNNLYVAKETGRNKIVGSEYNKEPSEQ